MVKLTLWFVMILASFCETNAYKLLLVSPLPGKSHAILADAMVEILASAGHEVTYITAFLHKKPTPRVTYVDVSENLKYFDPGMNKYDPFEQTAKSYFTMLYNFDQVL